MIIVALGMATAIAYGASDFLGGMASRRANASLAVVALLKIVSVVLFMGAIAFGRSPNLGAIAWGAGAGIAVGLAYVAYFRGLAAARMGVVATITAVWGVLVPLSAGLMLGERPSFLAWMGIGVIICAIVLITYTRPEFETDELVIAKLPATDIEGLIHYVGQDPALDRAPTGEGSTALPRRHVPRLGAGVADGTAAGICFGMFAVCFERASVVSHGMALAWPLMASAVCAALLVGSISVIRRVDWRAAWEQKVLILAAGVLYAGGTAALILAISTGWLSIVAVVAALSPAPTMLLARVILAESLSVRQYLGAALGLCGVVLVTAGLPD